MMKNIRILLMTITILLNISILTPVYASVEDDTEEIGIATYDEFEYEEVFKDKGIKVTLSAREGVVPEGAEVSLRMLDGSKVRRIEELEEDRQERLIEEGKQTDEEDFTVYTGFDDLSVESIEVCAIDFNITYEEGDEVKELSNDSDDITLSIELLDEEINGIDRDPLRQINLVKIDEKLSNVESVCDDVRLEEELEDISVEDGTFVGIEILSLDAATCKNTSFDLIFDIIDNYMDPKDYLTQPFYTGDEVNSAEYQEIKQLSDEIVKDCTTSYDKAKAIAAYLYSNISYDFEECDLPIKHSNYQQPYVVLSRKKAICQGYSTLNMLMLRQQNIPVALFNGENHAYNVFYCEEQNRWVLDDACWGAFDYSRDVWRRFGHHEVYSIPYFHRGEVCYKLQTHEDGSYVLDKSGAFKFDSMMEQKGVDFYTPSSWILYALDIEDNDSRSEIDMSWNDFAFSARILQEDDRSKIVDISGFSSDKVTTMAFFDLSNLKSINFLSHINEIGDAAFAGCERLESIDLRDSDITIVTEGMFEDCYALETVKLPDSVTRIDRVAFAGCSKLSAIDIPENVEHIGESVFTDCDELLEINIPRATKEIGLGAFADCDKLRKVNISGTAVSEIDKYTFSNCKNLEELNLEGVSVQSIGERAFENCEKLRSVDFSSGNVEVIGNEAFANCTMLEKINLANSDVSSLGTGAFKNCSSLVALDLLKSTFTAVAEESFYNCINLEKVQLPSTVEVVEKSAFEGDVRLRNIGFSDTNISEIMLSAFEGCNLLNDIDFSNKNIKKIGKYAFKECKSISEIDLMMSSLTEIPESAFERCIKVNSVKLPITVENIGATAFAYNDSLVTVYLPMKNLKLGGGVFYADADRIIDTTVVTGLKRENIGIDINWRGRDVTITGGEDDEPSLEAPVFKNIISQNDGILLQWGNTVGATSYTLYRAECNPEDGSVKSSYSMIYEGSGNSYRDSSVSGRTVYAYKIKAVRDVESSYSESDSSEEEKNVIKRCFIGEMTEDITYTSVRYGKDFILKLLWDDKKISGIDEKWDILVETIGEDGRTFGNKRKYENQSSCNSFYDAAKLPYHNSGYRFTITHKIRPRFLEDWEYSEPITVIYSTGDDIHCSIGETISGVLIRYPEVVKGCVDYYIISRSMDGDASAVEIARTDRDEYLDKEVVGACGNVSYIITPVISAKNVIGDIRYPWTPNIELKLGRISNVKAIYYFGDDYSSSEIELCWDKILSADGYRVTDEANKISVESTDNKVRFSVTPSGNSIDYEWNFKIEALKGDVVESSISDVKVCTVNTPYVQEAYKDKGYVKIAGLLQAKAGVIVSRFEDDEYIKIPDSKIEVWDSNMSGMKPGTKEFAVMDDSTILSPKTKYKIQYVMTRDGIDTYSEPVEIEISTGVDTMPIINCGFNENGEFRLYWDNTTLENVEKYQVFRGTLNSSQLELLGEDCIDECIDTKKLSDGDYLYIVKAIDGVTTVGRSEVILHVIDQETSILYLDAHNKEATTYKWCSGDCVLDGDKKLTSVSFDEDKKIETDNSQLIRQTPDGVAIYRLDAIGESGSTSEYFIVYGKYDISYEIEEGVTNNNAVTKYSGETLELKDLVRTGYDFKGWTIKEVGGEEYEGYKIVAGNRRNIIAKPKWSKHKYNIAFDLTGGKSSKPIVSEKIEYQECVSIPDEEPVKAGSIFKGWYTIDMSNKVADDSYDAYLYDFDNSCVTAEVKLYAGWMPRYKVENVQLYVNSEVVEAGSIKEVDPGITVSLSCGTNMVQIYYTFDDSMGSTLSVDMLYKEDGETLADGVLIYTDAIGITETLARQKDNREVNIYAMAVRDDYVPSDVIKFTFKVYDRGNDWGQIGLGDDGLVDESDRKEVAGITIDDDLNLPEGKTIEDYVPHSLWVSGIPEAVDYNGTAITFDKLHVYNYKTLLKPNVDYAVKYANNVKAGMATITVTGKGNYSGSIIKNFTINPLDLSAKYTNDADEVRNCVTAPDVAFIANGRVQKGTTAVTYRIGDKDVTLKNGVDYTYSYVGETDYKSSGEHIVTIKGKGNYTGEATFTELIIDKDNTENKSINKMKFLAIASQMANGSKLTPGVVVKDGTYGLEKSKDYDVIYQNNILPGTATAIITGKGTYVGSKVVTFKITALPISKATVSGIVAKDYTGLSTSQDGYVLTYTAKRGETPETLVEGTDYTVSYLNEVNAGSNKATIVFSGINRFTGVLKKNYTINAHKLLDEEVTPDNGSAYIYQKGKTTPKYEVTALGKQLVEGVDYTVSYTNNTTVNDASNAKKVPTVTITGKGNYVGKVNKSFVIVGSSLINTTMNVSDVTYANKAGICKPTITLLDSNGSKLAAGTDYDKTDISYVYNKDAEVVNIINKQRVDIVRCEGSEVDLKNDIIPEGTEIKVTVKGINNYAGSEKSAVFRYIKADMAKATVKVQAQNYKGNPITVSKDNISVIINKVTLDKQDYEIVSYSNNNKVGNASLTIRGRNNYGGMKTVAFKINAMSIQYSIAYDANNEYMSAQKPMAPLATGTMKVSNTATDAKITSNAFKRNGYSFVGWNTKADGSGKDYTNQEKFRLKDLEYQVITYGTNVTLYAMWTPVENKITYNGAVVNKNSVTENPNPATYNIEEGVIFASPSRTGYTFAGWYTDNRFKNPITQITPGTYGNKTIYAKWDKIN